MKENHKLAEKLAELDEPNWFSVLEEAKRIRRERRPQNGLSEELRDNPTRDEYAHWIAQRHLAVDMMLQSVVYLPANAPDDEVRLLEVTSSATPNEIDEVLLFDFTPDDGSLGYMVVAADISPDQWSRIQQNKLSLPPRWSLEGKQIITRDSCRG